MTLTFGGAEPLARATLAEDASVCPRARTPEAVRGMLYRVDYSDPQNPVTVDLTGSDNTWNPLPNTGVAWESLVRERGSNGGTYVATDIGVYYINNAYMADGTGWHPLGTALPRVECKGLEINYKVNKLRAGMVGRGLWEHDLWCPDEQTKNETGTYAANAFVEVTEDITSDATAPSSLNVTYRAGNTVHLQPDFHAATGSAFHAYIHPCSWGSNSFRSGLPQEADEREARPEHTALPRPSSLSVQPNPNSGTFQIRRTNDLVIRKVEAVGLTGETVPVHAHTQDGILHCRLTAQASGHYTVCVLYVSGIVEYFQVIVLP